MTSQLKTLVLMACLSALLIVMGGALGGSQGVLFALVFAVVMNVGSYWYSDKIVLAMYRAQELSPADAPLVHQIVEELAGRAGVPKPRLFLVPQDAPNAFATGRDPEHGVIAVTSGIMQLLPPEQLRGVLAHEMAHIAHRDILIQTVAGVIASAITALANMLQWAMIFGGRSQDEEGGMNPLAALFMMILGPLAASLIQMAISRRREYMADAAGAEYCADPMALAGALAGLDAYSRRIPMRANPATENMFIVSPLSGSSMNRLFSTHPPMEERIANLEAMARTGRYPG
ncbi:zinc metalloprotease HtpX [uncultured Mailhella sp.]|uniref:zinc metalloprotease HtpX n=1 Tax=uncultured Mailhella sp. TaxID=1981031 RepID=UPI00260BE53C|nr:zinc metalloprotease HtpX [uncultured Mailhella sp.]